jgi:DNA-3-methyladenine glycosylase II
MKLIVKPKRPFNFDLSAKIFSNGDRQIQNYENGKYWQVIRINNKLILITLTSLGTVDEPSLSVELKANEEISSDDEKAVSENVDTLFNLKFDLETFYESIKRDRIMRQLTAKLRGLRSPTTSTVFEALIDSIVEQQISLVVANNFEDKLIRQFGSRLTIESEVFYAFPTPEQLRAASIGALIRSGLSTRKAEYIRDISKSISEGELNLDELKEYPNTERIIEELDKIRGIGTWTAEMTVIRGMQKHDALPADDVGLRRTISHFYCKGRKITAEEARGISDRWGKWKGLAAYYLIVAELLAQS